MPRNRSVRFLVEEASPVMWKIKWRILPVGEVHDQPAALAGGHRRNTLWAMVSRKRRERRSSSPSRCASRSPRAKAPSPISSRGGSGRRRACEGGDELFTFFTLPKTQSMALRSTNVIERIHEEFRRRVKTQGSLPSEDAALILLFSLVVSGQIRLRRIDRWTTIAAVLSQHASMAA